MCSVYEKNGRRNKQLPQLRDPGASVSRTTMDTPLETIRLCYMKLCSAGVLLGVIRNEENQ